MDLSVAAASRCPSTQNSLNVKNSRPTRPTSPQLRVPGEPHCLQGSANPYRPFAAPPTNRQLKHSVSSSSMSRSVGGAAVASLHRRPSTPALLPVPEMCQPFQQQSPFVSTSSRPMFGGFLRRPSADISAAQSLTPKMFARRASLATLIPDQQTAFVATPIMNANYPLPPKVIVPHVPPSASNRALPGNAPVFEDPTLFSPRWQIHHQPATSYQSNTNIEKPILSRSVSPPPDFSDNGYRSSLECQRSPPPPPLLLIDKPSHSVRSMSPPAKAVAENTLATWPGSLDEVENQQPSDTSRKPFARATLAALRKAFKPESPNNAQPRSARSHADLRPAANPVNATLNFRRASAPHVAPYSEEHHSGMEDLDNPQSPTESAGKPLKNLLKSRVFSPSRSRAPSPNPNFSRTQSQTSSVRTTTSFEIQRVGDTLSKMTDGEGGSSAQSQREQEFEKVLRGSETIRVSLTPACVRV
ncbi:hypothetical protein BJ742DRAFT_797720 [Cladochytrium replicatum]|nr:hypothetical protein BJ742DRAFT_797720 [Cladochytrium replicatum]